MAQKFKNQIDAQEGIKITNELYDGSNAAGTSGQVLSSTGTGTQWIDSSADSAKRLEVDVKNVFGATMTKGTVVHAQPTGTLSGNVIEVVKADANVAANMPAIGVLNEDLANNAEGKAVMFGTVQGFDTSSFSVGDELYVSTTAGAFTNTKPTATNEEVQKIAIVIKSHESNGLIKVFGAGRSNDVPNEINRDVQWTGGDLYFDEDIQARFLYSSNKSDIGLRIQNNGSNSFIDGEYGNLYIRAEANDSAMIFQADDGSGSNTDYITLDGSTGAVNLYHYGTKKFETTSTGVTVTGELIASTLLINGTANREFYIDTTNPDHLKKNQNLVLSADPDNSDGSTVIAFHIDGSEKAILNSSGDFSANGRGTFNDLELTSGDDHLTITESTGDWTINNAQQNNALKIYDGTGGVELKYAGAAYFMADSNGVHTATNVDFYVDTNLIYADATNNVVGIGSTGNSNYKLFVDGFIATDSFVVAGLGNGGVALTHNDGGGNANVTFNHVSETPEQNGSSGRIVVTTDSTTAKMTFELADNVTSGVAVDTPQIMELYTNEIKLNQNATFGGYIDVNGFVEIGEDVTYPTNYGSVGFGGRTNGYARIFGGLSNKHIYMTSGTGGDIKLRVNGTAVNVVNIASDGNTTFTGSLNIESTSPTILFDETDVTANWRNRVSGGSWRVQYASDGSSFSDQFVVGASNTSFETDATFAGDIILDDGTTESPHIVLKDDDDVEFRIYNADSNTFHITRDGNSGADFVINANATDYTQSTFTFAGATLSAATIGNWNTAYNDHIADVSFSTGDGVLTLTQKDGGTLQQDLDGRYAVFRGDVLFLDNGEISDFTGAYQMVFDANDIDSDITKLGDYTGGYPAGVYFLGDGGSTGTTLGTGLVKVWHTGHFAKQNILDWEIAYDHKINSASFNSSSGVLTLTRQDATTVTVDLDGKYVNGSGTANYIPKWTDGDTLGNSSIYESGSQIGIDTTTLNYKLNVAGSVFASGDFIVDTFGDTYRIGADDYTTDQTGGVMIRPADNVNPTDGDSLFTVRSGGGSPRLFVEHSGTTGTTNLTFTVGATSTRGNGNVVLNSTGDSYLSGGGLNITGNLTFADGGQRNIIGPTNQTLGIFARPNNSTEGIKFSTDGGTTTEMFIQDGGNVGIGDDNPSNLLTLYKNATQGNPSSHTPANATLKIEDSANTMYLDGNSIVATGNAAFTIGNTAAADIIFYTNALEIMRLDSSGKVGINEINPLGNLHIEGGQAHNRIYLTTTSNAGTGYDVEINMLKIETNSEVKLNMGSNSNSDSEQIRSYQNNIYFRTNDTDRVLFDNSGNMDFTTLDGVGIKFKESGFITIDSDNNDASRNFQFKDGSGTNLMTIYDNQDIDVYGDIQWTNGEITSDDNNTGARIIARAISNPANDECIFAVESSGSATRFGVTQGNGGFFRDPLRVGYTFDTGIVGTPSYDLDVNGDIRATDDIVAFSDIRVKENIITIDSALDKVNKLRGVEYNKIGQSKRSIGVIAQEIEKVLPEVVSEDAGGMKSVAYGNITSVLIEAIKELSAKVEALENKKCNCNCK